MPGAPVIDVATVIDLVDVNVIVAGPPQSNVTAPPPESAVSNAASVQVAGEPDPTVPAASAACGTAVDVATRRSRIGRRSAIGGTPGSEAAAF